MKNFKNLFLWSLAGHFLIGGIILAGSALPARRPGSPSVYRVEMVETAELVTAGAEAAEPAAVEKVESPAEPRTEPEPEPEPEVKISPEEEQRRREEAAARAQAFERRRRELEESRLRRQEQERDRRKREREQLEELRRLERELSEAKSVGSSGIRADERVSIPGWLADEIHNRIYSAWEPVAARAGAELSFFISRTGSVSSITIERSSGIGAYDDSCVDAIRNAGRMPALPESLGRERVRVYVEFKN